MRRMLAPMDRQNDNRAIRQNAKVYSIRETRQHTLPGLAMSGQKGQRARHDALNHPRVVLRTSAESQGLHPLLRVGIQHLGLLSLQQLPANFGPWDRVVGSLLVVGPPAIQLSPLLGTQRQLPLALVVGQTLPQRHRQIGPIAGREPQQLHEYAGFRGVILSCRIRCERGREQPGVARRSTTRVRLECSSLNSI
jgi:hypothetical protein